MKTEKLDLDFCLNVLACVKLEYERYGLGVNIKELSSYEHLRKYRKTQISEALLYLFNKGFVSIISNADNIKFYFYSDSRFVHALSPPSEYRKTSSWLPINEHIDLKIKELNSAILKTTSENAKNGYKEIVDYLTELRKIPC